MASTSASTAVGRDDRRPEDLGLRGQAGGRVDQMVELRAAAPPAPAVAARGRERAAGELERELRSVDRDGPQAPAADGEVAAGVDEAGAGRGEDRDRPVDGVALRDPAEVEPTPPVRA